MSPRVGGECDEVDWTNRVHVLYAAVSGSLLEKLSYLFKVSYSLAEAEMSSPNFNDYYFVGSSYNPSLMNDADTYSKLDYSVLELNLTATYRISKRISVSLEGWYEKFVDEAPYVYGDLDGSAWSVTGYLTYKF